MRDDAAFAAALAREPALVWIETPSNPLLRLTDIAARAKQAKAAGALVLADNTLPTPCRQHPLALGCDLVLHSTTKALNGHGDLFGGALLAASAELVEQIAWWGNAAGLFGSAHDSWQTLRGLRTLPLRIDRQEASARAIAAALAEEPEVLEVHYPGLEDHPDFELAARQQSGPGFMIAFRLRGGAAAAERFLTGPDAGHPGVVARRLRDPDLQAVDHDPSRHAARGPGRGRPSPGPAAAVGRDRGSGRSDRRPRPGIRRYLGRYLQNPLVPSPSTPPAAALWMNQVQGRWY